MNTIPTNAGPQTPSRIVDLLVYSNFAANRDAGMSAEAYGRLLKRDVTAMEAEYQREKLERAA